MTLADIAKCLTISKVGSIFERAKTHGLPHLVATLDHEIYTRRKSGRS
jgi:hypothetical protein